MCVCVMCVWVCVHGHTGTPLLCRFKEDKRRAEKDSWRIPERELFLWGLFGGAIGGFVAMVVCHHKTIKLSFCIPYTVLFIINLAVLVVVVAAPYRLAI